MMAITQNTYTGNGSTVLYSFAFPYLDTADVKVSLNGTVTTAYTFANATTIQFNTAPANGAAIRIYRETDDTALQAVFSPGSSIRASDLNDNFDQLIYLGQEANTEANSATATANTALTNSATAISTANTASTNASAAVSTANTASANASAAVTTANTASTNASAAVSTANTASTNATTALNTANSATTTANNATSTANTALSTANTALTNANAAVSTANTASTNASNAVSTANTASTNATNAVNTANTASTNASTAVTTANSAVTTANAAAAAVANAVLYTTVANVAAIPGSPSNNTAIEVTNSTGIESFTPLSGLPGGFVGSSGLSVRIIYQTTGATWTWIQYFPNDPETRYFKLSGGTITGAITVPQGTVSSPGVKFSGTGNDNTGVYSPGIDELGLVTNGVNRLSIDSAGAVSIPGTLGVTGAVTGTSTVSGSALIPTGSSVPTNGVYLPAANSVAISTGGSGRLFINSSGQVGVGTSSPGVPLDIDSAAGTGLKLRVATNTENKNFSIANSAGTVGWTFGNGVTATAKQFVLYDNDAGAARILVDSSGRVGIGTSSNLNGLLTLHQNDTQLYLKQSNADAGFILGCSDSDGFLKFQRRQSSTNSTRMVISDTGNVGIGTASPDTNSQLHVVGSSYQPLFVNTTGVGGGGAAFSRSGTQALYIGTGGSSWLTGSSTADGLIRAENNLVFATNGNNQRAQIDSSGRLLVGTSTAVSSYGLQIEQSSGSDPFTGSILLRRGLANASINSAGYSLGTISAGSQTNVGGSILFESDAAWGSGDYPTRLVFSTTADGASSPTERMRLDSSGNLKFNSGYGSVATAYGVRAWVVFNGTGTISIRGSGNCSSITDLGTGLYRFNFSSSMPDANYFATGSATPNSQPDNTRWNLYGNSGSPSGQTDYDAPATSDFEFSTTRTDSTVFYDAEYVNAVVVR